MRAALVYLFSVAASPISAFPRWPKHGPQSAPYSEGPYHHPKHLRPRPTGSGSPNPPVSSPIVPLYPITTTYGGGLPTGTGFPTGTGSLITGTSPGSIHSSLPVSAPRSTPGGGSVSAPIGTGLGGSGTASPPKGTSLPSGCLKKNGIAVGWLPEAASDFSTITSNLGKPGCYFGQYAQITSSTFDGSQLTQVSVEDIDGAIFIASVMPSIPFSEIDSNVASQVAAVMKKFTDQGVEVYLRFGHEMNWYAQDGTYHGTSSEFITAWKNIASKVADNSKVSMYWSPNNVGGKTDTLAEWWPGPDTVDIVGIDIYPNSDETFSAVYKSFHDAYAMAYNKPFVIGETGTSSSSDDAKKYWLQQLSSSEAQSSCPNYVGFSWFEYNKGTVFYIASHGDNVAKEILG